MQHLDALIVWLIASALVSEFAVMAFKRGCRLRGVEYTSGAVFVIWLLAVVAWPISLLMMIVSGRDLNRAEEQATKKKGPWDAR